MKIYCLSIILLFSFLLVQGQPDRWQQRVQYQMDIDFDVENHQFKGKQKLKYWNNSPDTLNRVFYHLYFNAFQPGSMMDIRSRTISDPDRRVGDRISQLAPDEIGFHEIDRLKQDGKDLNFEVVGTILEVQLEKPLLPGKSSIFEMEFHSQVPVQIRRSGRDNAEGIDYSMAQWYPKMCEYDYQGWHANPYVGREFYGIWGDFDVKINIDDSYVLGATGVLKNAKKIGRGYSDKEEKVKGKKICWEFEAENVHDFVWAADPDYIVDSRVSREGVTMYFVYQPGERTTDNWKALPKIMDEALGFMNERYGKYPYPVYSFIQGGDGGMEYPMATLITGERSIGSLVGVSVHEWMHSWYQMILGTNEALYPWMDEGFTTFASGEVMDYLRKRSLIPGDVAEIHPNESAIRGYINLALSGIEEPLSTHADHFVTNRAYGAGSYTKGAVFMKQLEYIIGERALSSGLLRYYNTWKFKHPNVNDFIRIMEKESDLELDWYKEYFVNTTHTIDYSIAEVSDVSGKTEISLSKNGIMPMPLDLYIDYADGSTEIINIPLQIMRGAKAKEFNDLEYSVVADWPWTNPNYQLSINRSIDEIESITIDKSFRLADVNQENNKWMNSSMKQE